MRFLFDFLLLLLRRIIIIVIVIVTYAAAQWFCTPARWSVSWLSECRHHQLLLTTRHSEHTQILQHRVHTGHIAQATTTTATERNETNQKKKKQKNKTKKKTLNQRPEKYKKIVLIRLSSCRILNSLIFFFFANPATFENKTRCLLANLC